MTESKQKILVTGGAGYIGTVLTPLLLERGHEVTVLDTFASGEPQLAACCAYESFKPVRGDVRDEKLIGDLVQDKDVVIPLAAMVGAPLCDLDPFAAQTINQNAIEMLLSKLRPEQKVIYPNSNSGYGVGDEGTFCTEDSPLRPVSLYGRTKVAAEEAVLRHENAITFRLATVFGMSPHMRVDLLVNDFTHRALTDRVVVVFEGHFKRNYIHIRDVAKAFLHALDNFETMKGKPYNVGLSDANLSKLELCAEIKERVPNFTYLEAPFGEDPDKRDYIVSNERIEGTGWQADWSLERGIDELIKGYQMLRIRKFSNV
jgi:nucleoside-diphosphate-sugar epimerase